MLPIIPTGNETSADVYRLLWTIHGQLENFEAVKIRGLEDRFDALKNQVTRLEAQLQRIEQRVGRS